MKRTTLFAIGLIASAAAAGTAMAEGASQRGTHAGRGAPENHQGGMAGTDQAGGMGNMGGMMEMMHVQMKSGGMMGGMGSTGGGMMGGMGSMGSGMMGGMGSMGSGMMGGAVDSAFDTDGDGTVSPEEMRAGLAAQLKEYDADGNGVLSIAEFETLNSAATRNLMVDRFQALDEDGDGQITSAEMAAPAVRLEKMMAMRARGAAGAGSGGQMPMGQGAGEGMGQDDMMKNGGN